MIYSHHSSTQQNGAALIIGLLLLVVLSLLAVAGMNSASLEFIMAGNEQYKQNAFQSAETGIQYVYAITTDPIANDDPSISTVTSTGNIIPGSTDTYDYTLSYSGKTKTAASPTPTSLGSSGSTNTYASYHWQVDGTGHSTRSSLATHRLGFAKDGLDDNSLTSIPCTPMPTCQQL